MTGTIPELRPPLFELGLKCHLWGAAALELARAADRIAAEHKVTLLLTPQVVDLAAIAAQTRNILLVSAHLDAVAPGRGSGSVLPEAVKESGADGALLNHAEKRLTLSEIACSIRRAKDVGLFSIVCADSPDEAAAIAELGADAILAEPPELIGGSHSVASVNAEFIARTLERVRRINPRIRVLNSAGIRTPHDAAEVIRQGADGTGTTSGVVKAADPAAMLKAMVAAVEEAFRDRNS